MPGRCSQTYVFAWNAIFGPETDHRDPDQWLFYVVSAEVLPDRQKSISLSQIERLSVPMMGTNIDSWQQRGYVEAYFFGLV